MYGIAITYGVISLPKLIDLLMALLLVGSTFVGGIIYFIK